MHTMKILALAGLLSLSGTVGLAVDCRQNPQSVDIGFPYGTLDQVGGNFKERETVEIVLYNDDVLLRIPIVRSRVTYTGVRISPDQYIGYENVRFHGVIVIRSQGPAFYADRKERPLAPLGCLESWSRRVVQPYMGSLD